MLRPRQPIRSPGSPASRSANGEPAPAPPPLTSARLGGAAPRHWLSPRRPGPIAWLQAPSSTSLPQRPQPPLRHPELQPMESELWLTGVETSQPARVSLRGRDGGVGAAGAEAGGCGKMAARRGPVLPLLLLAGAVLGPGRPRGEAGAALDLRELSELKYGLEILAEPVLAGQRGAEDVVTVASKFKQRYECRLPPAALRPPPAPPEEAQLYNGSGVAELLRPMGAAPCLVKTKDWWTYEFCYGKHIQQYHVEESEIKGSVLFLGHYQSAFNWDDETAKASKQHRLKRYHSQSYVNGSRCDLTGRPREAEVRFVCEEGAGDYLARVDEPQSCSYVLTVHTPRLCRHPHLRPPPGAAPQPILCQPALSPAQYVQYVRAQVSDTKRKVEEISEELKTLDTRLWSERDAQPPPQPPQEARGDAQPGAEQDPKEAAFWERVREVTGQQRGATEEEPTPTGAAGGRKKIHFKVIRSPGDLLHFIEELKESTRKAREKTSEEGGEKPPEPPTPQEPPAGERPEEEEEGREEEEEEEEAEEEEEEEEEGELLGGGLEKELGGVLLPPERMAQLKEEVKSEMEKEFDNIINEVEDELEPEGLKGEFDRQRASKALASTLNRLMDKLDAPPPAPPAPKQEEEEEESTRRKASAPPPAEEAPGGGVRVRVSRLGQRQPPGKEGGGARDPPQLQHLESEVRELLAKEGLRAEGKIEIKIVTAGGGAGDEEEAQWLSDEDTKNLKDIFLNILIQGTEEAQKERRRQQALEDNYRFVWGGRAEPQPPSDSEDAEF